MKTPILNAETIRSETDKLKLGQWKDFRKKPVVIKALKLKRKVQINTLEGTMIGNKGDFLIRGFSCDVYPCKPDIFAKTYEKVKM